MNEDVQRVLELLAAEFGVKRQEPVGSDGNTIILVIPGLYRPEIDQDQRAEETESKPGFNMIEPPDISATYD